MKTTMKMTTMVLAGVLMLSAGAALAEEPESPPLDAKLFAIGLLADDALDLEYQAETLVIDAQPEAARKVYETVQEKLVARGDLLIDIISTESDKRVVEQAKVALRNNMGWLSQTVRTVRALSRPIANND